MRKFVFGPINSRRLGRSLGIDLVTAKTCPLDCIYCEAKATTDLTITRKEYVPVKEVIAELEATLQEIPAPDFITFSGAGEPTLNSRLGELAQWIKLNYPRYKICLLTNGTLLGDPSVRAMLQYVDLAMPNFDASSEEELQIINRPAPGITVESLAEGIRQAAAEYPGKLVLELFVVPGVNDSDESIARFAEYIQSFKSLHSVQLNTLDRPGVVDWIKPAGKEILKKFIAKLEKIIPVETVGRFRYRSVSLREERALNEIESAVIELVSRRPAAADDLAVMLSVTPEKARNIAESLVRSGVLCAEKLDRGIFYSTV